jgi:hypothetical protein
LYIDAGFFAHRIPINPTENQTLYSAKLITEDWEIHPIQTNLAKLSNTAGVISKNPFITLNNAP